MTRRPRECYVCGAPDARTMDHVFPRSLWALPYPEDALTAPACNDCQNRLAPDETYFRTVAAASAAGRDEIAGKLWAQKVKRSFDRDPRSRERLGREIRVVEWRTPAGLYLGPLFGLEPDRDRIGNVLRKIVRGLWYLERDRAVMPFDLDWNFFQESPLTGRPPDFVMVPLRTVGNVVRYKFVFSPDEPRLTIAWMAFYGRTMFTVWTGPEDVSKLGRLIPPESAEV